MKTIILATAAVLGIGIGAAYAGDGEDGAMIPDTAFNELPGVIATAPGEPANDVAAQNRFDAPVTAYGTTQPNNTVSVIQHPSNGG
jgi:hypothetical protein